MKLPVLPAVAAVMVATSAFAEEPAYNWSGIYFGAQIGKAWGESRFIVDSNDSFSNPDPSGFFGGLYLGYNFQLKSGIVVGVDADVSFGGGDGSDIVTSVSGVPLPFEVVKADVIRYGAVRARLGYAIDRYLPYVAGGVTFADVEHTLDVFGARFGSFRARYQGWTVAAGLEYALADALLVRGEYRHSDFGKVHYPGTIRVLAHDLDLAAHELRFGVAFKF